MKGYTVLYPGSFDPFTIGHLSIAIRALVDYRNVIIAVGDNEQKKNQLFKNKAERVKLIERSIQDFTDGILPFPICSEREDNKARHILKMCPDSISVIEYSGMQIDAALRCNARFIIYGIRDDKDMEDVKRMRYFNELLLKARGLDENTIAMSGWRTDERFKYISSSVVKSLCQYREFSVVSQLVTQSVYEALQQIYSL